MGLVQRVIERGGITTVGVSTMLKYTEAAEPPRTLFLKWPMGHAIGEPDFIEQQSLIVKRALNLMTDGKKPGEILKPPYRWRRHEDLKIPY